MIGKDYVMGEYDVIVVGAGHAGAEAGLACARLGEKTLLLSINLDSVASLPCSPSIGGTGKGHLVREIDALGGEMGLNIDKTFIQSKMLNTAKGPAVHSLRAQADKDQYHLEMKKTLELQEGLTLRQGEVVSLIWEEKKDCKDGEASKIVTGVKMATGSIYKCKAVILCTGTYLKSSIFIGSSVQSCGPNGLASANHLSDSLNELGLSLRRFKTGTPARVLASSLNYDNMVVQNGDEKVIPFSFMNDELNKEQVSCWLTYTNEKSHEIIRNNFHKSALFGGLIEGIGPRYCPSIEDKINRFGDKPRHQLFVEPEGLTTNECYLQGMSSSMPEEVQLEFYKSIPGLENLEIVRSAYAIEYDCVDPLDLKINLETRKVENLFCAGQFNGSSGYEEAACQGLMAGINAHLKINKKKPFVLRRDEAYIGVLLDDLITKGTEEPYRIMTSRAEYRLILRQDNADLRLTDKSYQIGLVKKDRYVKFLHKKEAVELELERLNNTSITPSEAAEFLENLGSSPLKNRTTLCDILRRPEITYENLAMIDKDRPQLSEHIIAQLSVTVKYQGYIDKQMQQINRFKKLEDKLLPQDLDYLSMDGLRIEARQKLDALRPISVGQAGRISGVSPADINVLLITIEKMNRQKGDK